jgi:hypothetical protein
MRKRLQKSYFDFTGKVGIWISTGDLRLPIERLSNFRFSIADCGLPLANFLIVDRRLCDFRLPTVGMGDFRFPSADGWIA